MIDINRHTYETFFLLYIDRELSVAEMQAVEQFVKENPDLAVELDMLQQALLLPDDPVLFAGKPDLYKTTADIDPGNYEDRFLCYVDNELDTAQQKKVETFVLQHPELQDAFNLLKQTRLEPEMIVFAGKQSLYRTEKKERPVVYARWWRIAAAAAVIGLGVMLRGLLPGNVRVAVGLAGNQPVKQKQATAGKAALPADNEYPSSLPPVENQQPAGNSKVVLAHSDRASSTAANTADTATKQVNTTVDHTVSSGLIAETELTLPAGSKKADDVSIPSATKLVEMAAGIKKTDMTQRTNPVQNSVAANNLVQPAVYKELNTAMADENKSLYLGSVEINKDKLRGFFRKASGIFRSKAARQEEEGTDKIINSNR